MRFLLIFCCISIGFSALGQRNCGTPGYVREQVRLNPALAAAYASEGRTEQRGQTTAGEAQRDTLLNEVITIPVVIHLLYKGNEQNISDAQIRSQLAVLNRDYRLLNADTGFTPAGFKPRRADVRIQFCLAQVDPRGYRTTGIVRKQTNNDYFFADDGMKFSAGGGDDAWDTKQYLNIWVCNMFGRVLGYGTPPGGPAAKDGVVIMYDVFGTTGSLRAPFTKGRTTTHEVGHWLGLKHLWGDDDCGDDGIDDTPRQKTFNFGCPAFPHLSGCGSNGNGDMFMNFMDYTDDACMNIFTAGQKKKMRSLFAQGNVRNSFLVTMACDSTAAQGGPLPDPVPAGDVAGIKVFPNPVNDVLTISSVNAALLVDQVAVVTNIQGVKVLQQRLLHASNKISLAPLPAGIYFLRIGNSGKTIRIVRL